MAEILSRLELNLDARKLVLILAGLSFVAVLFLLDKTDVPFIRNLPSVPGVPVFGNLFQLGTEHPKRLAALSRRYGPVFQIRLGNRVGYLSPSYLSSALTPRSEVRRGKQLRVCQGPVGQESVEPHLTAHPPYIPQCPVQLPGIHNRHVSLG